MGALAWLEFLNFAGSAAFLITTEPRVVITAELRDLSAAETVIITGVSATRRDLTREATARSVQLSASVTDVLVTAVLPITQVTASGRDLSHSAPERGSD